MGNIGMGEMLIIFLVALLIFGAKRLPEIARGLGQGISEFKKASREIANEFHVEEPARARPPLHQPVHTVSRAPEAAGAPDVATAPPAPPLESA